MLQSKVFMVRKETDLHIPYNAGLIDYQPSLVNISSKGQRKNRAGGEPRPYKGEEKKVNNHFFPKSDYTNDFLHFSYIFLTF